MKLYREKGVNPVGMIGGCLPMLLQMPIWAALYAMLFYAIELWHQPAFYGVFQAISNHRWMFLADLSTPDRLITLPGVDSSYRCWLVRCVDQYHPDPHGGDVLLPAEIHHAAAGQRTAAQQQKMMMITTFIFPLMFYPMPSGLTLYIMASTAAGIVDSYVVKRHIKRRGRSRDSVQAQGGESRRLVGPADEDGRGAAAAFHRRRRAAGDSRTGGRGGND